MALQEIVDKEGYMALRQKEECILLGLNCKNAVISTGGSAAYSDQAMTHLKKNGMVIFLNVNIKTLQTRIYNYTSRGIAKRPDQSFTDLFHERFILYKKYADLTIDASNLSQDTVCATIINELKELSFSGH